MNAEVAESAEKRQERWAGRARSYHPAMKPRPRIRKFFKWGGLVLSVLVLTVWLGSAYVYWAFVDCQKFGATAMCGYLLISVYDGALPWAPSSFQYGPVVTKRMVWWGVFSVSSVGTVFNIPLWPFVALSLATTAAAWRMDIIARRKSRLGKCPACGYDRTGLAPAAPCPECNAKA